MPSLLSRVNSGFNLDPFKYHVTFQKIFASKLSRFLTSELLIKKPGVDRDSGILDTGLRSAAMRLRDHE